MSLLNQVLQDLDERAPAGAQRPVRLAEAPPAASRHVDDFDDAAAPDWVRLATWLAVVMAAAVWIWVFFVMDDPVPRPGYRVAPQAAAAAVTASPVQAGTDIADETPAAPPREASGGPAQPPVAQAAPLVATVSPMPAGRVADSNADLAVSTPEDIAPPVVQATPAAESSGAARLAEPYIRLRNATVPPVTGTASPDQPVAIATATGIKTIKPSRPQPLARARAAIAEGELAEAENLLHQRLRTAPNDRAARELLVGLMLRGERHAAAMRQIDQGLQRHPGHINFALIKARLLTYAGSTAAAVELLEGLRGQPRNRAGLLQMLGALYQQQARYAEAVASYRELLVLTPLSGAAWAGLAISLDGLGDAAAIDAYRRALEIGELPAAADAYARQRLAELKVRRG